MPYFEDSEDIPPLSLPPGHFQYYVSKPIWTLRTYRYLINFWIDNKKWSDFKAHHALRHKEFKKREALIIIKRNIDKIRKLMETRSTTKRKRIKQEPTEELLHPDSIPCSIEIETIIKNKKIKIEYDD